MNDNELKERILSSKSWHELDLGTHISLKHKYVYFQVSKAASSTVKHHLQLLEVRGTGRAVKDVNNRYFSPHVWPTQLSESAFLSILRDPEFKKVAFVRNPFSRLLSCYMHRIVGAPRSASNKALKRANGGLGGPEISFRDFIRVVCSQESIEQESHWRVQSDEILYELVDEWEFIGKVERIDSDVQTMLDLVSPDSGVNITADSKANLAPMVTDAGSKVMGYYDSFTQAMVVERYRPDFEYFGYSTSLK